MANATLSPEVTDILSRAVITDNLLVLPAGQLERKLYEQVAKAIKAAGGAWKTNKQGFVFSSDPREKLGLALTTGVVVDEKKLRQAFYTPQHIADHIALLSDVAGKHVLEPSAGGGALVAACLKFGATKVDCIEMEPTCRDGLGGERRAVMIADFLTVRPYYQFERVVMNPPFTKGQDVKHIQHAKNWLSPGGKLFAVVPDKENPKLTAAGAELVERFPVGTFKESGTSVATRLIRIVAL